MHFRAAVMLLLTAVNLLACSRPYLSVEHRDGNIILDFQTLGEYPSSVRFLQIEKVDEKRIIWEVQAEEGNPQLWTVELRPGSNNANLNSQLFTGRLKITHPQGRSEFFLETGVKYRVIVRGNGSGESSAEFYF